MGFLEEFKKESKSKKMAGIATSAPGPSFWIDTGNFVLNKIISGRYRGGIPQGRMSALAGPSGAGKSFVLCNIIKGAQQMGCGVLVVDSENALDDLFLEKIGANPAAPDYVYRGVSTINQSTAVVSSFLASYRKHNETAPFLIVVDSLDAMMTDNAKAAYDEGIVKGDQGQQAKQLKTLLTPYMHDIKDLNIAILCTKQVFKEQDPIKAKNPATEWSITPALQYCFSAMTVVSRLFLKDDATKIYEGFKLKVFGFKTRFTKPFQQATIEVPYDTGMDSYAGLKEVAISLGVVIKNGSWNYWHDNKFQGELPIEFREQILEELILLEDKVLTLEIDPSIYIEEAETSQDIVTPKSRMKTNG